VTDVRELLDSRELRFRPLDDWHEDDGPCLWWALPVEEPPHVGTPLDDDWPGYHTHWSPLPPNSEIEAAEEAAMGKEPDTCGATRNAFLRRSRRG